MEVNYSQTYWCGRGKFEALLAALNKMVPAQDSVPNPDKNPALEKFRIASNCYYDLYNNGLGNRAGEFRKVFGFGGRKLQTSSGELTQELVDRTEDRMNEIALAAAMEQGLLTKQFNDYETALRSISALWPEPPNCAAVAPEYIGPNDGRIRADLLKAALEIARKALGKTCGA